MAEEPAVIRRQRRTRAQMEQIVREFRDSGLNGRQFCRRQGLAPSVLYRCLRGARSGGMLSGDRLVAVRRLIGRKTASRSSEKQTTHERLPRRSTLGRASPWTVRDADEYEQIRSEGLFHRHLDNYIPLGVELWHGNDRIHPGTSISRLEFASSHSA